MTQGLFLLPLSPSPTPPSPLTPNSLFSFIITFHQHMRIAEYKLNDPIVKKYLVSLCKDWSSDW